MPLELRLVVRAWRREREVAAADDVDAVPDPPAQVRLASVDARVEQRDRHAATVEARQRDVKPMTAAGLEVALVEQLGQDAEPGYAVRTG